MDSPSKDENMTYVYKIEVRPDAKKLGLKNLVGHVRAYFSGIPSRARMLRAFRERKGGSFDKLTEELVLEMGGEKLLNKERREKEVFNKAVLDIIRQVRISKDCFKTPKLLMKQKGLAPDERRVAVVSYGAEKGRLSITKCKVLPAH